MGLEDHKLKVFCTVAETKSFSKTSEIIHLTQPAVSLQIQALEEFYETKLFDRSGNTINLTPAGEVLYKHAKEILNQYSLLNNDIGRLTGLVKGTLNVGASSTIGNYILPTVIVDFKNQNPKINVSLVIGNTKRIVDCLSSGVVDLGIVEGEISRSKVVVEQYLSDELAVIVNPEHPWAKKKVISVNELCKEPFVIREEGSGTRAIIEKYLLQYEVCINDMKTTLVFSSTESIKQAIQHGFGFSILSKWSVRKELKNKTLKLIHLKEERMMRTFSIVLPRTSVLSNLTKDFLTFLRTYPYDTLLSDKDI